MPKTKVTQKAGALEHALLKLKREECLDCAVRGISSLGVHYCRHPIHLLQTNITGIVVWTTPTLPPLGDTSSKHGASRTSLLGPSSFFSTVRLALC